jgi:hypothetical protein
MRGRSAGHGGQRRRLFGLLWPLTLAQSHTGAATVLVNELNAGGLQSARERREGRSMRQQSPRLGLKALDSRK